MNDLYFENELRNKEREKIIKMLDEYRERLGAKDAKYGCGTDVFQNFDDVLDIYYSKIFDESTDYEEIYQMIQSFKNQFTSENLVEMYNKYNFSHDEIEYINLIQLSSRWRGEYVHNSGGKYAVTDILLRAKIIEQFGEESLQVFKDIIQNELPASKQSYSQKMIGHYMQLLSDNPYGENIHEKFENELEEQTKDKFNYAINCGGYALKIDQCVFPSNNQNFSQMVSSFLEKFPFIRLLGDKLLEDDEYLVIYRALKGKEVGHHFIRVDSDATVREKEGSSEPKIFEKWEFPDNDIEEALFAVKKEHEMFGYTTRYVNRDCNGLDFEEEVAKAIREKQNSFSYHNHSFCMKKSKEDEVFVTTTDGKVVADVVVDGSDCLVEVLESKKSYVENTSGPTKPIIRNGKLINFDKFKARKIDIDTDEGEIQ